MIDLQNAQTKILKREVGQRPKLNDLERAMLARMAHDLDQHILTLAETIVTPQTLKDWYRRLIAKKYDGTERRPGPAPLLARHPPGHQDCSTRWHRIITEQ